MAEPRCQDVAVSCSMHSLAKMLGPCRWRYLWRDRSTEDNANGSSNHLTYLRANSLVTGRTPLPIDLKGWEEPLVMAPASKEPSLEWEGDRRRSPWPVGTCREGTGGMASRATCVGWCVVVGACASAPAVPAMLGMEGRKEGLTTCACH